MKTTNYLNVPAVALQAILLLAISFLFFSCSAEDVSAEKDLSATAFEAATAASSNKAAPAPGEDPIAAIAIEAGFDELVKALFYVDEELQTQLVDLFLNGTDQYTVFAPTNEAFQELYTALEVDGIENLPAELVRDVLYYHVVEGRRAANSVIPPKNDRTIETLLGVNFTVDRYGKIYAVGNTANITPANNISASNGIIHVIDAVILPIE